MWRVSATTTTIWSGATAAQAASGGMVTGYTASSGSATASFSVGAIIIFVRLQTRLAEPDKWNFTVDEFNFNELVDRQSAAECSRLGRWAKLSDFATLHLYNSELKYYLKYELVYTLHLFMG